MSRLRTTTGAAFAAGMRAMHSAIAEKESCIVAFKFRCVAPRLSKWDGEAVKIALTTTTIVARLSENTHGPLRPQAQWSFFGQQEARIGSFAAQSKTPACSPANLGYGVTQNFQLPARRRATKGSKTAADGPTGRALSRSRSTHDLAKGHPLARKSNNLAAEIRTAFSIRPIGAGRPRLSRLCWDRRATTTMLRHLPALASIPAQRAATPGGVLFA
jgi:hypothetical protein